MNRYTVEWNGAAEIELAAIWSGAVDRDAVTAAQALADRLLARDALHHGRHVAEGLYQVNCAPLAISYTVDDARRHVEVTWVRIIVG